MSLQIEVADIATDAVVADGNRSASLAEKYVIRSEIECAGAVELVVSLEDAAKAIKKRRDFILEPLKEAVERVKATAAEPMDRLSALANRLRDGIKDWHAEQERIAAEAKRKEDERRAAEERAAREAAEKAAAEAEARRLDLEAQNDRETFRAIEEGREPVLAEPEPVPEVIVAPPVRVHVPEAPRVFESTRGQAVMKKRWTYEVTAIELLPEQYVKREPNLGMLRLAVASGVRQIPGVRIYQEDDLSIGKRR